MAAENAAEPDPPQRPDAAANPQSGDGGEAKPLAADGTKLAAPAGNPSDPGTASDAGKPTSKDTGTAPGGAGVAPDLTPSQRKRVELAQDHSPMVDEAAWYPLLENVMAWPKGKTPPALDFNWDVVMDNPGNWRGAPFRIVGEYPRRAHMTDGKVKVDGKNTPPVINRTSRPGPWQGKMQVWRLVIQKLPEGDKETITRKPRVAVVYLTDPPKVDPGDSVEIVGRFFKVWRTTNEANVATDYPVFVAQGATVTPGGLRIGVPGGAKKPGGGGSGGTGSAVPSLLMGLVIAMAIGFYFFRKKLAASAAEHGGMTAVRARRYEKMREHEEEEETEYEEPVDLPKNPADALAALEERRQDSTHN